MEEREGKYKNTKNEVFGGLVIKYVKKIICKFINKTCIEKIK